MSGLQLGRAALEGCDLTRCKLDNANLANAEVKVDPKSPTAFSERIVEFAQGDPVSGNALGVHVAAISPRKAFRFIHSPNDPMADAEGNVWYPDIDPVVQNANGMLASRAYEANLAAIEASKAMFDASLRIIA